MVQKRLLIAFLVVCTGLLLIGTVLPVHGEQELYDTVVRLHVLANSDSEEDQALKLKVRDAVLQVTGPMLEGCRDQNEAMQRLNAGMGEIRSAAEEVIAREGRGERVTLELGEEEYPKRDYDRFCFPSGTYVSLRIAIGEAEGKNWWCCLFPRLCLGAATVKSKDAEDACISVGLTPDQYKIITETEKPVYRVRFRLLELLNGGR